MESKFLSISRQDKAEYGHELAYKLAREKLAKIDDIEQQCLKSGALYQVNGSQKAILVQYLNQSYQITFPDIETSLVDSEEKVSIRDKILILHYLARAKGTPNSNRIFTYKELPEGNIYFPTFYQRTVKPLLNYFGQEPSLLADIAQKLSARKADYGDVAVTINVFSRVPIVLVLWRGDSELAPEGNIMFDSNISDYLATEDITVLCENLVWRMVRLLKAQ
ncbi:DUF3786 domain-containing protein [Chloroflexota bacterium]